MICQGDEIGFVLHWRTLIIRLKVRLSIVNAEFNLKICLISSLRWARLSGCQGPLRHRRVLYPILSPILQNRHRIP